MCLKRWFDSTLKELYKCEKIADAVLALEEKYKALSDEELQGKTIILKKKLADGATLDDIMVEAFATAREAATRILGLRAYRVQIIGAATLHFGNVAEMKTGEGKTLTSVLTAYLNALSGKGVHIVTVNEYLANRDATEMGAVHKFLGLTVGLNIRDLTSEQKKEQYLCDITYTTNNEIGFDYLRDHMVIRGEEMVLRGLNFAIIDEVDSILIDEARTPLIISGNAKSGPNHYTQANSCVRRLREEEHYEIDIKQKHVTLTEKGIVEVEKFYNLENLYDIKNVQIVHLVNNALRANFVMANNVDYVVKDNTVIIVDSFTGRLMHGRQYSEGLHQALEAKENVEIKKETRTLATITFQNFFRLYKKLSGMTGTAKTEEEEFRNIYNMFVVEIPTNRPIVRDDADDLIFKTTEAKYAALAEEIAERHKKGQPILVGTISIETSEIVSDLLDKKKIPHNVLNAKKHDKEAEIIAHAGEVGAVTIATNMAGRGTDIKLGEGVVELGGLAVIGTERHESRRIDNQLRGRSGRQGDPGYSRFYLAADDELLRRFGSDRFKMLVNTYNRMMRTKEERESGEELPLELKQISRFVESAQRKVEGQNFDRRKSVVDYDEVLRKQREIIYQQRSDILFLEDIKPIVQKMMSSVISRNVISYLNDLKNNSKDKVDFDSFGRAFFYRYFTPVNLTETSFEGKNQIQIIELLEDEFNQALNRREEELPKETFAEFLRVILLSVVDRFWMDHIDQMSALRQSIGLQAIAQLNPLREYQQLGFQMFNEMIVNIEDMVVLNTFRAQIRDNLERKEVAKPVGTSGGSVDEPIKKKPTTKAVQTGPNDPCPCGRKYPDGTPVKYKHCCRPR